MYKNQCMMWHSFEENAGICQLTKVLKICQLMLFCHFRFSSMVSFRYVFVLLKYFCFCFMSRKYYLSKLMLLNFCCQKISFLCKRNHFIDEKLETYAMKYRY